MSDHGYAVEVAEGYEEAVSRTRSAFKAQGFSVLTEMDITGRLGQDAGGARQYLIMGMWNSALSERPIDDGGDVRMAVHLPCNVVVQETEGAALVAAFDPAETAEGDEPLPEATADAARAALSRMLQAVGGGA